MTYTPSNDNYLFSRDNGDGTHDFFLIARRTKIIHEDIAEYLSNKAKQMLKGKVDHTNLDDITLQSLPASVLEDMADKEEKIVDLYESFTDEYMEDYDNSIIVYAGNTDDITSLRESDFSSIEDKVKTESNGHSLDIDMTLNYENERLPDKEGVVGSIQEDVAYNDMIKMQCYSQDAGKGLVEEAYHILEELDGNIHDTTESHFKNMVSKILTELLIMFTEDKDDGRLPN